MIHRPTFDPEEDLVVTLCLITIGVKYTGFRGAHLFSKACFQLIRRLIIARVKSLMLPHQRQILTCARQSENGDL